MSELAVAHPRLCVPVALLGADYAQVKDPCPVHHRDCWHLFGTAITRSGRFEILHARSDVLDGPWRVGSPVDLPALRGSAVAAPGVVSEGEELHMFLQSDFNRFDGRIEHLVSVDGGFAFEHQDTALRSLPGSEEAGIYDPHPSAIDGQRYLVYSAFRTVGEPDIHLARSESGTWRGPWERLGAILRHEDVPFHNARQSADYEWGLEGAQLLALPDGEIVLNAVCFLPDGPAGARQRVFLAIGDEPTGPFALAGRLPAGGADGLAREQGHAVATVDGPDLALMLQRRAGAECPWGYGMLRLTLEDVVAFRSAREP